MVVLSQQKFLGLSSIFLLLFFLLSPQSTLSAKTNEGSCVVMFSAAASNCLGASTEVACDKLIKVDGKPCLWKTEKKPASSICKFKTLLMNGYCDITDPAVCDTKKPFCTWNNQGCVHDFIGINGVDFDSECKKNGSTIQDCHDINLYGLANSCVWTSTSETIVGSCELDKKSAETVCSAQKTPETCANPADNYKYVCEWKIPPATAKPSEPTEKYNPFIIPSVEDLNKIGTTDASILIARIIKALMGILGSISLVMFVYGGILYMTDGGNSERAGKAKQIFVWNSLGLVVIFASYAIVKMIFEAF